jgi:hypothetical protein
MFRTSTILKIDIKLLKLLVPNLVWKMYLSRVNDRAISITRFLQMIIIGREINLSNFMNKSQIRPQLQPDLTTQTLSNYARFWMSNPVQPWMLVSAAHARVVLIE